MIDVKTSTSLFRSTLKTTFLWILLGQLIIGLLAIALVINPIIHKRVDRLMPDITTALRGEKPGIEELYPVNMEAAETASLSPTWLPFNRLLRQRLASQYQADVKLGYESSSQRYLLLFRSEQFSGAVAFGPELIGTQPTLTLAAFLTVMGLISLAIAWLITQRQRRVFKDLAEAAMAIGRGESLGQEESRHNRLPVDGYSKDLDRLSNQYGIKEVDALFRTLHRTAQSLEEEKQQRLVMLAGISHDIRTPISRLRLMLCTQEDKIPADLRYELDRECLELDHLVQLFLDGSRSKTIGVRQYQPWPLQEWLLERVYHSSHCSRIDTDISGVSGDLLVTEDPQALARVVDNLIENAARYSSSRIDVQLIEQRDEDNRYSIIVRDHGAGIPQEKLAEWMKPYRGTVNTQGSGLGLSIVNYLCQQHQWQLVIANHPDGGLMASVSVPMSSFTWISTTYCS